MLLNLMSVQYYMLYAIVLLQYSFNVTQATNKYFFPDLDYYDILKIQNE